MPAPCPDCGTESPRHIIKILGKCIDCDEKKEYNKTMKNDEMCPQCGGHMTDDQHEQNGVCGECAK